MQVNQPEVQRAVTRNLVNDPAFRKLIMDENKVRICTRPFSSAAAEL